MRSLGAFCGLIAATVLALLLEQSPAPPRWLPGGEWVLLPVILTLAAFALPPAGLWALAFVAGLLLDLVSQTRLGASALAALLTALALHAARPAHHARRWYAHALCAFCATLLFQGLAFLTFCLHQGRFLLAQGVPARTLSAALFNAALAPLVLLAWNLLADRLAHAPARHGRARRHAR